MHTTMRRPADRWLRGRTGSRVLAGTLAAAVLAAAAIVTAPPAAADDPWVTSPQEDYYTAGREGAQNHDGGTDIEEAHQGEEATLVTNRDDAGNGIATQITDAPTAGDCPGPLHMKRGD